MRWGVGAICVGFVWLVARPGSLGPLGLWLLGLVLLVLGVLLAILGVSPSSRGINRTARRPTSSQGSNEVRQHVYRSERGTGLVPQDDPRFYIYKVTHDHGAAPCVDGGGLLTLAICKPMIRRTAGVGEVIFGFAANSLSPDNRLIYIARVTSVEEDGDYYDKATYKDRDDRIYIRGDDGRFRLRSDARYHQDGTNLATDLGSFPEYERARVRISDDFRYFESAPDSETVDLSPCPHLQSLLRSLGQGHRVTHPPARPRRGTARASPHGMVVLFGPNRRVANCVGNAYDSGDRAGLAVEPGLPVASPVRRVEGEAVPRRHCASRREPCAAANAIVSRDDRRGMNAAT